jgi:hypothetical protein
MYIPILYKCQQEFNVNVNFLSPTEFKVSIKRLPNIEFYVQKASVPGISSSPVTIPTPFNPIYQAPEKLTYSNLNLSFIIDEQMTNYIEIYNWLTSITLSKNFTDYNRIVNSEEGIISDITLHILSSHKNANVSITFFNCFPVSISEISLDLTASDVTYPEATVEFQYETYTITKNS